MKTFLSLLVLLSLIHLAEAKPLILKEGGKAFYELGLYLDILEDPTNQLTIDDVSGPKWASKFKKSDKTVHNFGFSKSSFWARINIQNKSKNQLTWLLSQNYYQQDEVKFYRIKNSKWQETITGDTLPFSEREMDTKSFTFKISPKANSFYYMK